MGTVFPEFDGKRRYEQKYRDLRTSVLELKRVLDFHAPFDYLECLRRGKVLFVGEGNLSFSLALSRVARNRRLDVGRVTATTFEPEKGWQAQTKENAQQLKQLGGRVMGGVDATKLDLQFPAHHFSLIAFQFPNVASRRPVYGRNPNHVLMRRFLVSAAQVLSSGGLVAVSVLNSPHYDGAFDMSGAAKIAGFEEPQAYPFRFRDYSGYSHSNTRDQSQSAVDQRRRMVTFVFRHAGKARQ